jgi:phosphotransferase system HPr (HPr) family protein
MKEFRTHVVAAVGLHARPASLFAQMSKKSGCEVRLGKVVDGVVGELIDGASILKIMSLGVRRGEEIIVQVNGESEAETSDELRKIVESPE